MSQYDDLVTRLYEEYQPKVLSYLWGKTQNRHQAEDMCSDVFMKVFQNIDKFDEQKATASTWIFTITRNTLTDYYRRAGLHRETSVEIIPEDAAICTNDLDVLAAALETLEERERDIIVLRYYEGYTLQEVAEKMGISYSYIKQLHNKALVLLKRFMDEE